MSIRPLQSLLVLVLVGTAVIAAALAGGGARQHRAGHRAEGWVRDPELLRCPNEEPDANTVKIEVNLPTKCADPVGEREADARLDHRGREDEAGQAGDAPTTAQVTEAVSKITWTATDRGLDAGPVRPLHHLGRPAADQARKLTFKAIQTYSNGTTVNWIQATVKGAPEPEHPAPVLTLTTASSGHH